jgi:ribonucleoside-diphosphate reductase alpha chain
MDYIFRRLALDYLDFETRQGLGVYSAEERQRYLETGSYEPVEALGSASEVIADKTPLVEPAATSAAADVVEAEVVETKDTHGSEIRQVPAAPAKVAHTSAELLEQITGTAVDSPLCMTCGTKMRPAGSCYVCEGCGSTSGCS